MRLTFDRAGAAPLAADIDTLVIAGWAGRDEAALRHHIEELAAIGVPRPSAVPVYYRVAAANLTQAERLEVLGPDTSGEAEPVIVALADGLWLGVGSDHTDRKAETMGIALSKQLCGKPVGRELWRLDEVEDHWDALVLRAFATIDGARVLYQEGALASLRTPADLIARRPEGRLLPGTLMFGGTLSAIGGIRPATRFEIELEDPVAGRRLAMPTTSPACPWCRDRPVLAHPPRQDDRERALVVGAVARRRARRSAHRRDDRDAAALGRPELRLSRHGARLGVPRRERAREPRRERRDRSLRRSLCGAGAEARPRGEPWRRLRGLDRRGAPGEPARLDACGAHRRKRPRLRRRDRRDAAVPAARPLLPAGRRWWDLPLRALAVMALVATVVLAGRFIGPGAAGVTALVPIVFTSLVFILHDRIGGPATAAVIAHSLPGMVGFTVAVIVLAVTVVPLGAAAALSLALLVSVAWNGALIVLQRLRKPAPQPCEMTR
jgi:hypothetical protein